MFLFFYIIMLPDCAYIFVIIYKKSAYKQKTLSIGVERTWNWILVPPSVVVEVSAASSLITYSDYNFGQVI